jgi:hypothetical protein
MSVRSFVFTLLRLLPSAAETEEITEEVTEWILDGNTLRFTRLRYLDIHNGVNRRFGCRSKVNQSAGNG